MSAPRLFDELKTLNNLPTFSGKKESVVNYLINMSARARKPIGMFDSNPNIKPVDSSRKRGLFEA